MTIEIEPERLDDARQKALRKLAPRARVPGFRPGKAPAAMVRQYFGEERILDEALDIVVPDAYRQALEADESIFPVARPRLVVETTDPLVVKATIPVRPTVELGDYQSVRVEITPIQVTDERIEEALTAVRRTAATLEPVERPVQWEDVVRLEVEGKVGDEVLVNKQEAEIRLKEDRDVLFPGFEEQLLGHAKGDSFEFGLDVPENISDERFSGKQCRFSVTIQEVKEEVLPELNDEFTKGVGEGFESVDALRERIRADIERAETERREQAWHDEILDKLVEQATIEFPPVMVESEIDRMLHDQGVHPEREEDMARYLSMIGRTAEELHEELKPIAEGRIRRSLVLAQAAVAEGIEVSEAEVDAELERMVVGAGPQGEQLRQVFGSETGRDTMRRNILTRKTLSRLVEIATEGKFGG
ncbi:MAG TPA: trigger factor, partial [Dehalococcoidia bacterium]|nr:trigger factor [Dehalococcoidia bacterium]